MDFLKNIVSRNFYGKVVNLKKNPLLKTCGAISLDFLRNIFKDNRGFLRIIFHWSIKHEM